MMITAMNAQDMVTITITMKKWMISSVSVMIALITITTGKTVGGKMIYRKAVQNEPKENNKSRAATSL